MSKQTNELRNKQTTKKNKNIRKEKCKKNITISVKHIIFKFSIISISIMTP